MDNLPAPTPNRQWFRLASLARMEAMGQNPDSNPLSFTSATPAQGPTPAAPRPPSPAPLPTPINPRPQPSEPPQSQPSTTKSATDLQSTTANLAPVQHIPPPLPTQPVSKPPPQVTRVPSRSPTPPPPQVTRVPSQTLPPQVTRVPSQTPPPQVTRVPSQTPPPQITRVPSQTPPPQVTRVPSRFPTPPQSPKNIKAFTPNPSESLRVPQQLQPHPEPEPEPEPKMPVLPNLSSNSSNGVNNTGSSTNGKEQTASSWNKKNKSTKNNDNKTKVITMAGENTGAYFELMPPRRGNNIAKGEQYKGKVSEESNHEGVKKEEAKPKRSVVNSNVQSVNNSIVFGTSCTLQSPGVHIAFVSRRQPKHKGAADSKSALLEN